MGNSNTGFEDRNAIFQLKSDLNTMAIEKQQIIMGYEAALD